MLSVSLFITENDPSPAQIVWTHFNPYFITRKDPYVVHSHFTGNSRQNFVSVLEFYPEHGVTERFNDDTILFNEILFSHTFWGRKDRSKIRKFTKIKPEIPQEIDFLWIFRAKDLKKA